MWKVITFAIFTIFAAQVSASGNDAIKRTKNSKNVRFLFLALFMNHRIYTNQLQGDHLNTITSQISKLRNPSRYRYRALQ